MMLDDGELGILDFQDGVVGPVTYDWVSLLRDCYIQYESDFVDVQLDRLIDVVEVHDITEQNIVWRELALLKLTTTAETRGEVLELAGVYRANVIDIGVDSLVMEISGGRQKIDSLIELLRKFGLREVLRTGRIATLRGTLVEGEEDGLFQADASKSTYELPIPTGESGSV